jgi:predicted phosphodiesterase
MPIRFRTVGVVQPARAMLLALLALAALELVAPSAHGAASTEPNLKVAIIGDQGNGKNAQAVLKLIKSEGADMVLHVGDFDYRDDPARWDADITAILGANFPYFGLVGNHDVDRWGGPGGYQDRLRQRLDRISGAECSGELGVKSSCRYRGLFFILSGAGTMGSGHEGYIRQQLEADHSTWRIVAWHKNQMEMQIGGKESEVGWGPYEACRELGAIIATGHEHSYERTKTLVSMQDPRVDPEWPDPDRVRVVPGATFAVVSGLGGRSIRTQQRCAPDQAPYGCNGEWASIYTSNQGAQYGALFFVFNVDGDPNAARGYFKNVGGQTIDRFTITAGTRVMAAAKEPSSERAPAPAAQTPAAPPTAPSTPPPAPVPVASGDCVVSRDGWEGGKFASQKGTFTVGFDMIPDRAPINAVTGLSLGNADDYDDLATSVRFSPEGVIDVRNGSRFTARTSMSYEPGARYHVRMVVRVPEHTYDVYVTPPGGGEQALAVGHAFRSDQKNVSALSHWATFARDGSHQVCGFSGPGGR